jgi:hypothetical protein
MLRGKSHNTIHEILFLKKEVYIMKRYIISGLVIAILLIISSVIPNAIGVSKDMDPVDGKTHKIGVCTTPPTLDGIVNVGSSWDSSQYVGGAFLAMNNSPLADVYMTVEVDAEDNFEYLWIGVKPISPFYLKPTQGQWLRIDWDQDGKLDYEDHTGWGVTDGADTSSGAEWMIPWGKVRINPGSKPNTMNFSLIGNSFDILIHIDAIKDGKSNSATFPDRPIPKPGEFKSTTILVDFTMGPPEEDDDWGIRSKGFWKHQFRTAIGGPGHQHVPTENLSNYLKTIDSNTNLSELKDLKLRDALMLLEPENPSNMYDKAVQQLLATWLNNVSDGDQMVDTDWDNSTDMMLSKAIQKVEDILNDPNSTKKELEEAKDICECINNSGED